MEVAGAEMKTFRMDHHGLVAAMCKDLDVAGKIDARLDKKDKRRVVSPGRSVCAMINNGLGFTNYRLYMTDKFFQEKPIEVLLDAPIQASDLTDSTLAHTLDEIAAYGTTDLFAEIAFEMARENGVLDDTNHLDTSTIVVYGEYAKQDPKAIKLVQGHSKERRHDLNQFLISLVVNGPASVPIFLESLDGNSSDKVSFHETVKKVEAFKAQLEINTDFKWVADSCFFVEDKLLQHQKYTWLTRVPETVGEANVLVHRNDHEIDWKDYGDGYKACVFFVRYGDVDQRWLLVYSQASYEREIKTFEKKMREKEEEVEKSLWHLSNQVFKTEGEAQRAFAEISQKESLFNITSNIVPVMKYAKRGKPKKGEEKIVVGFKLVLSFSPNPEQVLQLSNAKGRFILATNDVNREDFTDQEMLDTYKQQQKVEGGFRFLKDPWFMLDSVFLKLPRRIEALMMVMTLCLFVYNLAQYKIREKLRETNQTLPNQLKKEVQNPTMRWIFQIMEGIDIVRFYETKKDTDNLAMSSHKIIETTDKNETLLLPHVEEVEKFPQESNCDSGTKANVCHVETSLLEADTSQEAVELNICHIENSLLETDTSQEAVEANVSRVENSLLETDISREAVEQKKKSSTLNRQCVSSYQHLMTREIITNLSAIRQKIIRLFGDTACRMYGLVPHTG